MNIEYSGYRAEVECIVILAPLHECHDLVCAELDHKITNLDARRPMRQLEWLCLAHTVIFAEVAGKMHVEFLDAVETIPMPRFQTVIKSARFVYSPYTATEMQGFAQVLADSIRVRIQSGQNIYDQAAAPLKPGLPGRRGYPDYKSARGLQPILGRLALPPSFARDGLVGVRT